MTCTDRMKESSGLFAVKVRSQIADSFERRLVRGGERMKGRVDSKRHEIQDTMESLILAQDERWRHA